MSLPMPGPDSRAFLIETLGQNLESFELSNHIWKNGKPVMAVKEIGELEGMLTTFAKDPRRGLEELGPPPSRPDLTKYKSEQEKEEAEQEYLLLLANHNMMKMALTEHVPPEDMMMIKKYMKPFKDSLVSVDSVKGKKFFAFTKQVSDEPEGLSAMFGRKRQQG